MYLFPTPDAVLKAYFLCSVWEEYLFSIIVQQVCPHNTHWVFQNFLWFLLHICIYLPRVKHILRACIGRSRWSCGLRRSSVAAGLLGRGFESRWGHGWSSVEFVVCCVGSSLCDKLIILSGRPTGRACVCVCLILCDLEASTMRQPRPDLGCCATKEKGRV
jgi:hypothetical protein